MALRGRTLLDLALDRLAEAGAGLVTVHADGDQAPVAALLAARAAPACALGDAPPPGGGPLWYINADNVWLDGPMPAMARLRQALTDGLDGVLLVHRGFQVQAEIGAGDYFVDPLGVPEPRGDRQIAPYIDTGVRLMRAAALGPEGFAAALAGGRLRCVVHDGLWFPMGTPEDLEDAELAVAAQVTGPTT